ncbi:MAG: hypothetical protein WDO19_21680 [Bacteroidota bacterium]
MGDFSMRDAIQKFLEQSRIKGDIQALQIEDVWSDIMVKQLPAIPTNCRLSATV